MRRRGVTLVELVVAMVTSLIVIGAVHRLVVSTQRLSRLQAAQIELQSSVRSAAIIIANEIRPLNAVEAGSADQIDILSFSGSGMTYRAARGLGFLCEPPAGGQLRVARNTFSGIRDPEPTRDLLYLLVEQDAAPNQSWIPLSIVDVATTAGCSPGGGITLTTSSTVAIPGAAAGTPVRFYETMELRLYQSDGLWWLGARSVNTGEAIQPFMGPLSGADGMRLEYLGGNGLPVTTSGEIKSIALTIRGGTEGPSIGSDGQPLTEQLTTQVVLRNALAP
jgi:hypothetical protein